MYNGSTPDRRYSATDGSVKPGSNIGAPSTTALDFNGTNGTMVIRGQINILADQLAIHRLPTNRLLSPISPLSEAQLAGIEAGATVGPTGV